MSAESIIAELSARGIELALDGASILARPKHRLTDPDRRLIREHKAELLALVNKRIAETYAQRDLERFERDRAIGRGYDVAPAHSTELEGTVIEATLRPAMPWPELLATVKPQNPGFPPCPECHRARYWIGPRGKVVCGSCGAARFLLTAIEFHQVQ